MTKLEDMLNKVYISLTEDLFYFPCLKYQPKMVNIDYFRYVTNRKFVALLVNTRNKSYIDVCLSVIEGLTKEKYTDKGYWNLSNNERRLLYEKISSHGVYQSVYRK